jgi:hypothetical protein
VHLAAPLVAPVQCQMPPLWRCPHLRFDVAVADALRVDVRQCAAHLHQGQRRRPEGVESAAKSGQLGVPVALILQRQQRVLQVHDVHASGPPGMCTA